MSTAIQFLAQATRGWPAWLPLPANRPDVAEFADTQAEDMAEDGPAVLPSSAAVDQALSGGWFDSSLDLKLGLEVVDLGPVEWHEWGCSRA